ncbi:MAG TPA: hypothetical protein DEA08_19305 [Planctomycetes bacterium]|nr:hypothetical protein [Planctomycetota bacterium]
MFDPSIYRTLDAWSGLLVAWTAAFALWTLAKVLLRWSGREVSMSNHTILTELPGLPLQLLHTAGFVLALRAGDVLSSLLFAWWGPGYLITAALVLTRGERLDWTRPAPWTSWGCKLSYVIYMGIYLANGLWTLPFLFSLWIMNDQVRLAWFEGNADRTRRTTEDRWVPRILYPGLLLLPFVAPVPGGLAAGLLGLAQLALWLPGVARLLQDGRFWQRPDPRASHNLRDIVYLVGQSPEDRSPEDQSPRRPAIPTVGAPGEPVRTG